MPKFFIPRSLPRPIGLFPIGGKLYTKRTIIGLQRGKLTVEKYLGTTSVFVARESFGCVCTCGRRRNVSFSYLRATTLTASCGRRPCILTKKYKNRRIEFPDIYHIWRGILRRCCDKDSPGYKWYGAVGIKVAAEWRNNFEAFRLAMGPRPSKGHSVDRFPDRKGNYAPGNVR